MYLTVDRPLFIKMFETQRPGDFSTEGLEELYDYLTDQEQETGEQKFDPVSITSMYAEVDVSQFNEDFQEELEDMNDLEKHERFVRKINDEKALVFKE